MASVKKFFGQLTIVVLVVVFLIPAAALARIRCGNDIISKGNSSARVRMKLKKCGEFLGKEIIEERTDGTFGARTRHKKNYSYTSGDFQSTTERTERWHILIHETGGDYCWELIFRGGILIKFEDWESCD